VIIETLKKDLISALKAKDAQLALVVRYLLSQIKDYDIELRAIPRELNDSDALLIIKRQIKKRKKAIEMYIQGSRQDIADKEASELKIMEDYFERFSKEVELPSN
jgi:uncharacterized protein YqeY